MVNYMICRQSVRDLKYKWSYMFAINSLKQNKTSSVGMCIVTRYLSEN